MKTKYISSLSVTVIEGLSLIKGVLSDFALHGIIS